MLDSDDSAASEVASEPEDAAFGADESVVASESDESDAAVAVAVAVAPRVSHAPAAASDGEDAYDDDEYEDYNEDGGYSDDFDDFDDARPSPSPARKDDRDGGDDDDDDGGGYGEASFEDESRRFASASPHHVVDLSVRVARDSPTFRLDPARSPSSGDAGAPARRPSPSASSVFAGSGNSPNVNLKVLSKPRLSVDPPSVSVATAPPVAAPPPAVVASPVTMMTLPAESDERKFSLLLRKVESKFEDKLEELREKNAVLTWKERELKAELRRQREELRMRKSRIDKKRKRAVERRHERERVVEALRSELHDARGQTVAAEERVAKHQNECNALADKLAAAYEAKRAVDERSFALAEKLQAALNDLHARERDFEAAVNGRIEAERRAEALAAAHAVDVQVLERKCQVELEAMRKELGREAAARVAERETLPDTHRRVVEAEKERFERLEAARAKQLHEFETQAAKDAARFEADLAKAWAAKSQAEDRAEQRVQQELSKIARERDAVDEQRRELLVSVARTNARLDEERARLDALRSQLDSRQSRLADERLELDARVAVLDERALRLEAGEAAAEAKRVELTALGREMLDKTRALARRAAEFAAMEKELRRLRTREHELLQSLQEREQREKELTQRAQAVEEAARQLQQDQLALTKQRVQSRRFLDGARQLERLMELQSRQTQHERGDAGTRKAEKLGAGRQPSDNQLDQR